MITLLSASSFCSAGAAGPARLQLTVADAKELIRDLETCVDEAGHQGLYNTKVLTKDREPLLIRVVKDST